MSKILLFLVIILTFNNVSLAKAPYSNSTKKILLWADDIKRDIKKETIEIKSKKDKNDKKNEEYCYNNFGWKLKSKIRFRLGLNEFYDSVDISKKNTCLREDVFMIDHYIENITHQVSNSLIACEKILLEKYSTKVNNLTILRDGLAYYGDRKSKDEEELLKIKKDYPINKMEGEFPEYFINDFIFWSVDYQNDEVCTDPQSFFTFHRIQHQYKEILDNIENLKKLSKEIKNTSYDFFTNQEKSKSIWKNLYQEADNMSKNKANSWFANNVVDNFNQAFSVDNISFNLITSSNKNKDFELIIAKKNTIDKIEEIKDTTESNYESIDNILKENYDDKKRYKDDLDFTKQYNELFLHIKEFDTARQEKILTGITELTKNIKNVNKHLDDAVKSIKKVCAKHGSCEY